MTTASKPIVLITGANGGLGVAAIKALCESPNAYHILVGTRAAKKGEDTIATVQAAVPNTSSSLEAFEVDIESDESIQQAFGTVSAKHGRVDVLINNAGVNIDFTARNDGLTTRQLWNKTWDVNVAGTQVMTEVFVPLLLKSTAPRLLFLTSGTASLAETERTEGIPFSRLNASPGPGWPKESSHISAYRSSKTGLNMMMREWRRLLKNDGVKMFAISPGFLATGFGGIPVETAKKVGAQDPSVGGNFIRDVVEGKLDQEEGLTVRVWPARDTQPW